METEIRSSSLFLSLFFFFSLHIAYVAWIVKLRRKARRPAGGTNGGDSWLKLSVSSFIYRDLVPGNRGDAED